MTSNPEALVLDAPGGAREAFRSSEVTVSQNLLWVTQVPRQPRQWGVHLCRPGAELVALGELTLGSTPDTELKRLSYVAHAIAGGRAGTVVYVNRAADAEVVALQLYGLRGQESDLRTHPRIAALIDLTRRTVHEEFALAQVLARGIAFHYGNMPLLIRTEIERLFSDGVLHFLVCTSTLIEGVNMSCRNMVVRGPWKGVRHRMSAEDFWNLAGRAGRWGKEFQGNIVCVDPTVERVWGPDLAPTERRQYAIRRTTDKVVAAPDALIRFIEAGTPRVEANRSPDLEFVFAYLAIYQQRHGTIHSLPWVQRLDAATVARVADAVGAAVADLRTPLEVIERNPGISPLAMDALLRRMDRPGRDPATLLPVDPASDDAWSVYTQIFTRIGGTLNLALGFTSRRSAQLALLVVRWMRGYPLSRLIQDRIDYLHSRGERVAIATVIRTVLSEVENIARFEAPRSLGCYVDLLRVYLTSIERPDLADQLFDLGLMLEFGVSRQTQVSLIGLGLSRTSAVLLNELLTEDNLSEAAALQWLVDGLWRVAELPALVKLEIEQVLALHVPNSPTPE